MHLYKIEKNIVEIRECLKQENSRDQKNSININKGVQKKYDEIY